MNLTRAQWTISGALAGAVVVLGIVALTLTQNAGEQIEATDDQPTSTTPIDVSDGLETSTTSTTTTSTTSATSTTTETSTPTTETTIHDRTGLDFRVLTVLSNDVELVAYSEPGDEECKTETLVAEKKSIPLFVYDEWGASGGFTAHPGRFDQLAIVGSCEEHTTGVWMAWTGGLGDTDILDFDAVELDPEIFSLSDFRWFGTSGWFGAEATYYDGNEGWVETVVFDPGQARAEIWANTLGTRLQFAGLGFDLVLPNGWVVEDESEAGARIGAEDQAAWVQVTILSDKKAHLGLVAPRSGETEGPRSDVRVNTWTGTEDRALQSEWYDANDVFYFGADGTRRVRWFETADRVIVIEAFTPDTAGHPSIDGPNLALEAVRTFDSFG